jgi:general secretion pathway protein C
MNMPASLQGLPTLASHPGLQRAVRHLPAIITALMIVLVAWQLARITWLLLPRTDMEPMAVPVDVNSLLPTSRGTNAQQIADTHIFGVAVAEAPGEADLENAPKTSIPLVLSGTIATNDPSKGFAFIGESAAVTKFVKVGDVVGGQAKLHSVFADRVILDRSGSLEALHLPRKTTLGASRPAVAARPPSPPPGQFADNLRRIAESNPSAFSEVIRPQPVFAGGAQKGYRVYPGRNRQQFASLGLRPGDLVTAINGTPLDDPARGNEILSTLMASDQVSVTVERNGQTQQLNLNTATINLPDAAEPTTPPSQGAPNQGAIEPPSNPEPGSMQAR